MSLVFAIYDPYNLGPVLLRALDDQDRQVGQFAISLAYRGDVASNEAPTETADVIPRIGQAAIATAAAAKWAVAVLPAGQSGMLLRSAGMYRLMLAVDGDEQQIGGFYLGEANVPTLTAERVLAIKSDPAAAKAVRYNLKCQKCPTTLKAYAAFERNVAEEGAGYTWYGDIQAMFRCACGSLDFDVSSIRRNLAGLLGQRVVNSFSGVVPMYEQSAVNTLYDEFTNLLQTNCAEEHVQKFIEANPLLLHQFGADQLFFKPPLLTHRKADFAILTHHGELIFVEIERPGLRILKKDGGVAAGLQHAIDQVREWLQIADDHRIAALDCLGLDHNEVAKVTGLVIAGRDGTLPTSYLRRLKGDTGRIRLLTYDDLQGSLASLSRSIGAM